MRRDNNYYIDGGVMGIMYPIQAFDGMYKCCNVLKSVESSYVCLFFSLGVDL